MIDSRDMHIDSSAAGRGRASDTAGRLPRPPTSFVGREHELAEARQLLDHNTLLTLTGPGGCGKTRLSIELAARVTDEYPDGVHFVSLAGIADPALVLLLLAERRAAKVPATARTSAVGQPPLAATHAGPERAERPAQTTTSRQADPQFRS